MGGGGSRRGEKDGEMKLWENFFSFKLGSRLSVHASDGPSDKKLNQ